MSTLVDLRDTFKTVRFFGERIFGQKKDLQKNAGLDFSFESKLKLS